MDRQFQNGGALFKRDKKSPNAADFGGDFTIDGEVLSYIENCLRRGDPVKLEISGWNRQGRNNTQFISLSINTPYEYRQNNQQSYAAGGRGQPDRRDERRDDRGSYGNQSRGEYGGQNDRGRGGYDQRDRGRPQERNGWDD